MNIPVRAVEEAIIQNEDVAHEVAGAADDLHQVNIALAQEVAERVVIESELVDTKTDLAEVRSDLSKSRPKRKKHERFRFRMRSQAFRIVCHLNSIWTRG